MLFFFFFFLHGCQIHKSDPMQLYIITFFDNAVNFNQPLKISLWSPYSEKAVPAVGTSFSPVGLICISMHFYSCLGFSSTAPWLLEDTLRAKGTSSGGCGAALLHSVLSC